MGFQQGTKGFRPNERAVAAEDEKIVLRGVGECLAGLIDRMAGTELLGLGHEFNPGLAFQTRLDQIGPMSDDHHDSSSPDLPTGIDHPVEHRPGVESDRLGRKGSWPT